MKTEFTTFDVIKILKTDRERLRVWINEGFVVPSIQKATGPGTKHLFSREDVYRIEFFRKLCAAGISRSEAARMANDIKAGYLQKHSDIPIPTEPNYYVIYRKLKVDKKGEYIWETEQYFFGRIDETRKGEVFAMIEMFNYDFVYIINFAKIIKDVDASISNL